MTMEMKKTITEDTRSNALILFKLHKRDTQTMRAVEYFDRV